MSKDIIISYVVGLAVGFLSGRIVDLVKVRCYTKRTSKLTPRDLTRKMDGSAFTAKPDKRVDTKSGDGADA